MDELLQSCIQSLSAASVQSTQTTEKWEPLILFVIFQPLCKAVQLVHYRINRD